MSFGRLGVAKLVANTNTTVYTVPATTLYSEITINVLNPTSIDANVNVAVATTATPNDNEFIEKGVIIPADGGVLNRLQVLCSPGERIVVRSDQPDVVVRVSGKEVIDY